MAVGIIIGSIVQVLPVNAGDVEGKNEVAIYAVNAGYSEKIEGNTVSNNWDFIELVGVPGVDLEGYAVRYVRSSGSSAEMELCGRMSGEYLLLRYRGSPQKDGDFFYAFDLAVSGGRVELLYAGEVIDTVGWKSMGDDSRYGIGGYFPLWEEEDYGWEEVETEAQDVEILTQCLDLRFTEIYSYFENDYSEQFVEIFNPTDEIIPLDGCFVRYKNKNYALGGEIAPFEYLDFRTEEMKLTKNPTSSNYIDLLDVGGDVVARAEWEHGQKKGTSMVFVGEEDVGGEVWLRSYAITPGAENVWQEYRSCPEGKVINPSTGNCIGVLEDEGLLPCPEGKFRNPETNRCKSLATIDNVLAPCKEGQFRNPETNRCKSLASLAGSTLTPCAEGYERNPETNRCRKIRENNGADYGLGTVSYEDKSSFMAYGALAAVGICGVVYIIWQFRKEICKPFRLIFAKIRT